MQKSAGKNDFKAFSDKKIHWFQSDQEDKNFTASGLASSTIITTKILSFFLRNLFTHDTKHKNKIIKQKKEKIILLLYCLSKALQLYLKKTNGKILRVWRKRTTNKIYLQRKIWFFFYYFENLCRMVTW